MKGNKGRLSQFTNVLEISSNWKVIKNWRMTTRRSSPEIKKGWEIQRSKDDNLIDFLQETLIFFNQTLKIWHFQINLNDSKWITIDIKQKNKKFSDLWLKKRPFFLIFDLKNSLKTVEMTDTCRVVVEIEGVGAIKQIRIWALDEKLFTGYIFRYIFWTSEHWSVIYTHT